MTRAPYTLVAELTYRCPLRCAYCSNPVELARHGRELDAPTWRRVLAEAEALGVVQLHLSGGEPLLRDDLEELVEEARARQLYSNLITSGTPLTFERLRGLAERGLDAIQISFQDVLPDAAAPHRRGATSSPPRSRRPPGPATSSCRSRSTWSSSGRTSPAPRRSSPSPSASAPTGWSWRTPSSSAGP
jgi:hypothetical protein